jgi:signal transduction histidine kinase
MRFALKTVLLCVLLFAGCASTTTLTTNAANAANSATLTFLVDNGIPRHEVIDFVAKHPVVATAQAREVIARQMGHLAGIVDDLLDVARVTTGKITLRREVADVAAIVRSCLDTLRSTGASPVTR